MTLGFLLGGEFDEVFDRLGKGSLVGTGLALEAVADGFGISWVTLLQYGATGACTTLDEALRCLVASSPLPLPTTPAIATAAPVTPAEASEDSVSIVTVVVTAVVVSVLAGAVSCTETVSLFVTATTEDVTDDDSSIVTLFISVLGWNSFTGSCNAFDSVFVAVESICVALLQVPND